MKLNHCPLCRCHFLLKQQMCPLFSVSATEVSVPPPPLALPKAFGYMLAKPRYGGNSVLKITSAVPSPINAFRYSLYGILKCYCSPALA